MWPRKMKMHTAPSEDPTSLCNLLVSLGWITEDTLQKALSKKHDDLIGQILLSMGAITEAQLAEALQQQKLLRKEISPKEAVSASLSRQTSMQDAMIKNLKDLGNTVNEAIVTGKFEPLKRGAK